MPLVSITVPAYNRADYIGACIDSLLKQTFQDFEIIVVNDGSTDHTADVVSAYRDPRIRLVHNEKNMGIVYTRNRGLQLSTGKYTAILDSDDIATPDRLQLQINYLESHPECALVAGPVAVIDEKGELQNKIWFSGLHGRNLRTNLFFENSFAQSAVTMRTSAIPEGGYNPAFPPTEDYDLWVRISRNHEVINLEQVMGYYRVHTGNISKEKEAIQQLHDSEIKWYQAENLLGRKLSESERRLHTQLLEPGFYPVNDIAGITEHADRLLKAAERSEFYNFREFENLLRKRWMHSFYRIRTYEVSQLSILHSEMARSLSLPARIKFMIKCRLKRSNALFAHAG